MCWKGVFRISGHDSSLRIVVLKMWVKCDVIFSPPPPSPPQPPHDSTLKFIDVTVTHSYTINKSFGTTVLPQWAPRHS